MEAPLLFLSHAGRDLSQARDLRQRLLDSPDAKAAKLQVWLDHIDLNAGRPWKDQIEDVIENRATAFAVIVGSNGIQNWVKPEVDAAMSRAVKSRDFRFIPVLMGASSGQLSPFARRFHAVRDPLTDEGAMQTLLRAALGYDGAEGRIALTDEPFCGLRSMDESWADRFFGRDAETAELVCQLRSNPVIAIVADSGAGKSSLAMAGVAAAWRGGTFQENQIDKPAPQNWNVVTFRPLSDPLEQLAMRVTGIAARQGSGFAEQNALAQAIRSGDAEQAALALNIGLPSDETQTLLLVDQAEELFTQTLDKEKRKDFCKFLAGIIGASRATNRLRVLFTIRADYAGRLAHAPGLSDFVGEQQEGRDRFRLKAMSAQSLREMIVRP